ncbi:Mlh1-like_protein [Hexamita inflata]|uniref:Mlh1-like protein n=1 Tax=Hexamita inflata TaxID=28002 RepID=A0AA86TQL5_9EUKA|nr:Mlh1-like protein [Hexamita inflata]
MLKILSEDTINRLAAGEVITSPIQCLKELCENSVDSGASKLTLSLSQRAVSVQDNGSGINPIDFPLLCVRFATSKLTEFSALQQVQTFGFRGEALCSLSYVGTVFVQSRQRNQLSEGEFRNSKLVKFNQFDNQGDNFTQIKVEFDEIEVNRAQALRFVNQFAMLHQNVEFSVDGENGLLIKAQNDITDRVNEIIKGKNHVVEFSGDGAYGRVMICTNAKNRMDSCFVNNRLVTSPFNAQIKQLFSQYIICQIFLTVEDTSLIDFNCHPQKLKVILINQQQILNTMKQAVSQFKMQCPEFKEQQKEVSLADSLKDATQSVSPIFQVRQQQLSSQIEYQLTQSQNIQVQKTNFLQPYYDLMLAYKLLTQAQISSFKHKMLLLKPQPLTMQQTFINCTNAFAYVQIESNLVQYELQPFLVDILTQELIEFFVTGTSILNPFFKYSSSKTNHFQAGIVKNAQVLNVFSLINAEVFVDFGQINVQSEENGEFINQYVEQTVKNANLDQINKKELGLAVEKRRINIQGKILEHNQILKMFDRL